MAPAVPPPFKAAPAGSRPPPQHLRPSELPRHRRAAAAPAPRHGEHGLDHFARRPKGPLPASRDSRPRDSLDRQLANGATPTLKTTLLRAAVSSGVYQHCLHPMQSRPAGCPSQSLRPAYPEANAPHPPFFTSTLPAESRRLRRAEASYVKNECARRRSWLIHPVVACVASRRSVARRGPEARPASAAPSAT